MSEEGQVQGVGKMTENFDSSLSFGEKWRGGERPGERQAEGQSPGAL